MQRKVAILQCFQVRLDCKVKLFMLQVFLKQSRFFKIKNTELHIKTLIIEYIITAIPIKIILFLQILLFLDYIPLLHVYSFMNCLGLLEFLIVRFTNDNIRVHVIKCISFSTCSIAFWAHWYSCNIIFWDGIFVQTM